MADFDLAIVGGGINGTGIARDAAGRGLRVLLVEQNDLASGTSSASTKLIYGGCAISSTAGSAWCARRWSSARSCCGWRRTSSGRCASCCHPSRACARPGAAAGAFVYDHIGGRRILPPTRTLELADHRLGAPLEPPYGAAWNTPIALRTTRGWWCSMRSMLPTRRSDPTRTRCIGAERGEVWRLMLEVRGRRDITTARVWSTPPVPGSSCSPSACCARPRRPARRGQPHRGAAPVRPRSRLHL